MTKKSISIFKVQSDPNLFFKQTHPFSHSTAYYSIDVHHIHTHIPPLTSIPSPLCLIPNMYTSQIPNTNQFGCAQFHQPNRRGAVPEY
jgi:hypothetical protein